MLTCLLVPPTFTDSVNPSEVGRLDPSLELGSGHGGREPRRSGTRVYGGGSETDDPVWSHKS